MQDKIFVVPENDLESQQIIQLLKRNGYVLGENLFVTKQGWGASWEGLEPEIKEAIKGKDNVYGVELQGNAGFHNIDHHKYDGDDRSNPKSSIEQVADLLGVQLTVWEMLVAANDKGYIPAMYSACHKLKEQGFRDEDTFGIIQDIRYADRVAQGITYEQEEQAIEALEKAEKTDDLTLVHLPHSKCATITDRLYGKYKNLAIVSDDGEINFYGDGKVCEEMLEEFGGWAGGELPKTGFFGVSKPEVDIYREVAISAISSWYLWDKDPSDAQTLAKKIIDHQQVSKKMIEAGSPVFGSLAAGLGAEGIANLQYGINATNSIMTGVKSLTKSFGVEEITNKKYDLTGSDQLEKDLEKLREAEIVSFVKDSIAGLGEKHSKFRVEAVADALNAIHEKWIEDNERKFFADGREKKAFMHLPIGCIGYDTAKLDLLFVEPVLKAAGYKINDEFYTKLRSVFVEKYVQPYAEAMREGKLEEVLAEDKHFASASPEQQKILIDQAQKQINDTLQQETIR